jgi:hypothetical protein
MKLEHIPSILDVVFSELVVLEQEPEPTGCEFSFQ